MLEIPIAAAVVGGLSSRWWIWGSDPRTLL
uniref:Uncharacterized protein n=1 Tax=Arundo donax TaxID=35708 RepID=A0A0A9H619_ARUDO